MVVIRLSSNLDVSFSPSDAQGLEKATPSQLEKSRSAPPDLAFIFQSWTRTFICRRFCKVSWVPEVDGIQAWSSGRKIEKRRQAKSFENQWEIRGKANKKESRQFLIHVNDSTRVSQMHCCAAL